MNKRKNNLIHDKFKRIITDLRISLTDQCNFRCTYCMPKEIFGKNYTFLPKKELLSFREIELLSKAFVNLGVEKLRLTGGEPLLRKNLPELIRNLKRIKKPDGKNVKVTLTTNGFLLKQFTSILKKSGLDRVTVSLDSLDKKIFQQMIDGKYSPEQVLAGIDAARDEGLEVKVNMVVKKGVNDSQILPMADYFRKRDIPLRFIEFMDVGNSNHWDLRYVFSTEEVIRLLDTNFGVAPVGRKIASEVAEGWVYNTGGTFGTISSVSKPFCANCSRARISSNGLLYTCLFASSGYDLKKTIREKFSCSNNELCDAELISFIETHVRRVWGSRSDRYSENRLRKKLIIKEQKIEMSYIGG